MTASSGGPANLDAILAAHGGSTRTLYNVNILGEYERDFAAEEALDAVPALVAELKRLRAEAELHALCNDGCVPGAAYRMLTDELDAARAEADGLRRQLLDETYRPEGGEIVLRELRQAKRERDAAVTAVERALAVVNSGGDGVFDVREWGERGTPFSNGAKRMASKVRRALDPGAEPGQQR